MPIISGQQDLDDEDMDEAMLDLVTLGRITKEDAAEIKAQDASNFLKIKTAFGLMNIKHKISEREKYSQPVDTSMHVVNSDFGVPVDEKYDNPELQIAHVGYKLDAEVEAATYKGDVDIDNKVGLSVIELAEKKAKEVEMKIDLSHIDKIEIEKKADNSLLDVDRRSKTINVELDEKFASLDIEPDAYVAEEYEGGGDIDIDEAKKAKDEIDIGFDDVGFTF